MLALNNITPPIHYNNNFFFFCLHSKIYSNAYKIGCLVPVKTKCETWITTKTLWNFLQFPLQIKTNLEISTKKKNAGDPHVLFH
jgi:hypothetical protein